MAPRPAPAVMALAARPRHVEIHLTQEQVTEALREVLTDVAFTALTELLRNEAGQDDDLW